MSDEPPKSSHRRHSRRHWALFITLALGVAGVWAFSHRLGEDSRAKKNAKAPPAVPITTTTARKGDIGVYIEALGTVTPVYSVNVISRVQGQVMSISYQEGQEVRKGDRLLEIDSRPYEAALLQAQGQLARDQALLKEARIDLKRYRLAYAKRAIPKQQLDDQEQQVRQDEGTVVADQGTLDNAKVNLLYCHITSPIDGRAGLRLLDPGNMVQANSTTPLVSVTQTDPITVIFSVAEDYLPEIQERLRQDRRTGQDAKMSVEAWDRALRKKLAVGSFLTLDNQIDPTTGTVKVKAIYENKDGALFPNQFVNARLLVNLQRDATLVSSEAVQRGAQGTYVFVVKPDQTAEIRKIKVGTIDGPLTAVEGVEPGDIIASNGFDKLQDKAKVMTRDQRGAAGRVP